MVVSEFRWCNFGINPDIEDQYESPFCLSYASMATLNAYYLMERGIDLKFSKQEFVDLSSQIKENRQPEVIFKHVSEFSMTTETNYPPKYKSFRLAKVMEAQNFKSQQVKPPSIKVQWKYVKGVSAMVEALHRGPLVGAVAMSHKFMAYTDYSVFKEDEEDCKEHVNHAVIILGYGIDPVEGEYWIVQNSYGETWGANGIGKIAKGVNMCGIEEIAFYPKLPIEPFYNINHTEERLRFLVFGSSLNRLNNPSDNWAVMLKNSYLGKVDTEVREYVGLDSRRAQIILDDLLPKDGGIQPSLALVYLGRYDSQRNHHQFDEGNHVLVQEYKYNLKRIADHLKSLSEDMKIIFLTCPPVNEKKTTGLWPSFHVTNNTCKEYSDACISLFKDPNIQIIDLWTEICKESGWESTCLEVDGFHLSKKGSQIVLKKVIEVIEAWFPDLEPTATSAGLWSFIKFLF